MKFTVSESAISYCKLKFMLFSMLPICGIISSTCHISLMKNNSVYSRSLNAKFQNLKLTITYVYWYNHYMIFHYEERAIPVQGTGMGNVNNVKLWQFTTVRVCAFKLGYVSTSLCSRYQFNTAAWIILYRYLGNCKDDKIYTNGQYP
jgi:hypothetical protein